MAEGEPVVLVDITGRVATVTLNRPDARNALSRGLVCHRDVKPENLLIGASAFVLGAGTMAYIHQSATAAAPYR